jgi:NodT family efflux transporter outer membrane factor (OMF) lipoprotein
MLILLLLFCFGCISMPKKEQTQSLIYPPTGNEVIDKSLKNAFFARGDWPEEKWWEMFYCSELNEFIDEALQQNPSIQAVEQKINFAKQAAVISRSNLFPFIYFNATDTLDYLSKNGLYETLNPTIPRYGNLVDLSLSFTYEFDFWSKYRNLFQASLGREKAEEAEAAQVTLIVTTALAQVYFALKTNLLKEEIYNKLVSIRLVLFDLSNRMQEKALFSKLPVWLSIEALDETKKELISIQEEIEFNKHLLNALRGSGPDDPLKLTLSLADLPEKIEIPDHLFLDLLSRRPDLMAAIWRVKSLAHDVGAAIADFFPNIDLTGLAGFETFQISNLFNAKSFTAGILPALHLPIFTSGAIRANVRAKKALFEEAVFDYNNLILKSAEEVANYLVLVSSVFKREALQRNIVDKAQKRYELTKLLEYHCLDSTFEMLAREEELLEKQLTELNLRYNQYASVIKLTKSFGGGYTSLYSVPLKADGETP